MLRREQLHGRRAGVPPRRDDLRAMRRRWTAVLRGRLVRRFGRLFDGEQHLRSLRWGGRAVLCRDVLRHGDGLRSGEWHVR